MSTVIELPRAAANPHGAAASAVVSELDLLRELLEASAPHLVDRVFASQPLLIHREGLGVAIHTPVCSRAPHQGPAQLTSLGELVLTTTIPNDICGCVDGVSQFQMWLDPGRLRISRFRSGRGTAAVSNQTLLMRLMLLRSWTLALAERVDGGSQRLPIALIESLVPALVRPDEHAGPLGLALARQAVGFLSQLLPDEPDLVLAGFDQIVQGAPFQRSWVEWLTNLIERDVELELGAATGRYEVLVSNANLLGPITLVLVALYPTALRDGYLVSIVPEGVPGRLDHTQVEECDLLAPGVAPTAQLAALVAELRLDDNRSFSDTLAAALAALA